MGAQKRMLYDHYDGIDIPCPECDEGEMTEDTQGEMTDGQMSHYLAGENIPFTCTECGHSELCDIELNEENPDLIPTDYLVDALGTLNEIQVLIHDNLFVDFIKGKRELTLSEKHLLKLLYGSSVTVMEAYLADAFKSNVIHNDKYLKKFIQNYKPYEKDIKLTLPAIIRSPDLNSETLEEFVQRQVLCELNTIIFHNLNRVIPMFKAVFGIDFPSNTKKIFKYIEKRHDIFHRNGKNIDGEDIEFTVDDVLEVIREVTNFINDIEDKLNAELKK